MRWMLAFGILLFLGISISLEVWKYSECKKVGHGTAYCVYKTISQ